VLKKSSKSAARKPRADAQRNRETILAVAREAFTRHGAEASFGSKAEAEEAGKKRGHELLARGQDAQLVIHREDGSIETEHTYGHDPRKTPG